MRMSSVPWLLCVLLLVGATQGSAAFSLYSVDLDDDGSLNLDVLATDGTKTRLAPLDFPAPFHQSSSVSVTASIDDGLIFVTNETVIVAIDATTGKEAARAVLPPTGGLRYIGYDYKHAADGAPGHSLYGLWEDLSFNISLVKFDKATLAMTTLCPALNVTGHLVLASLGLPKAEPQWLEPEMKHFGFVVEPAGDFPAPFATPIIGWVKLAGSTLGWEPLGPAAGNSSVSMMVMDYDGPKLDTHPRCVAPQQPGCAHNCYVMLDAPDGSWSAPGILHMKGAMEKIFAHQTDFISVRGPVHELAVDMLESTLWAVQVGALTRSALCTPADRPVSLPLLVLRRVRFPPFV